MRAETYRIVLPGGMLARGFWLYVWRIETPDGEMLYVGRTGDSSSPFATAPYTRMGQHLGFSKAANSLRRLLLENGIEPEACASYELISHGPIHPEIGQTSGQDREEQMRLHKPVRDEMAGLEKKLRDALCSAGYRVLNVVHSKKTYNEKTWLEVRSGFSSYFPDLIEKGAA
ncbi:hypothetical protein [Roseospirillum parvum]|uniref:GIY-YIG domain-containing protein n=1 Tax=Roseospirillum parvum TaxID=83401 RepID=A0A1G8F2U3_9PROT|nr:hypothetical protein [Roseospirillum parvum]SDH76465.1 hypothetical protein SAMN05421742_11210 [Roseospirillum parvum]